jgi:two-component system, sensor histidine kinase YesM
VQRNIFIWFVLIVVIPSGIIYFVINHFFLTYSVDKQITTNTQLVDELRKNLDTQLSHYQQLTIQFYLNEQAMAEITSDTPILDCDAIKSQLNSFVNANRLIVSAFLFTDKGMLYSGHGLRDIEQIHQMYQTPLAQQEGRILWTRSYPMTSDYGLQDTYFFGIRHIREAQQPIATLYLVFNSMFFYDFFQFIPFEGNQLVSVMLTDGHMIASNDPGASESISPLEIDRILQSHDVYERELGSGEIELLLSSSSRISDWVIMLSLSKDNISSELTIIRRIFYFSLVLYFIFFFYLSYIISQKLSRPLNELTGAIDQVGDGTVDIQVAENHIEEIKILSQSFNNMTHRIANLLDEVKQTERAKRKAYMQTLQLQLTPHFLYNTLNTIRWMAQINGQDNIVKASKALILYLKSLIDIESEFITVRKELSLIEAYATIQRYRYQEFNIHYEIPEELKELRIHKLMLINLIENSIIHGFSDMTDRGEIHITASIDETDLLSLSVTDDGAGIEERELQEIRYALEHDTIYDHEGEHHESGHVGILNIQNRLRLYHGAAASVTIISAPNEGCEVTITQPCMHEEPSDA